MTIYKCHNWAFNPKNQELIYTDGQVKQLPGRISLCLNTLIESRGETVLYEQLLMRVWGTTHKDPSTISSVISELRKLIGCGRDKVKLLHTVPKRGYRFIGEVEVVSGVDNRSRTTTVSATSMPSTSIAQQLAASFKSQNEAKSEPPQTQTAAVSTNEKVVIGTAQFSRSMVMVLFGVLFAISASILSANFLLSSDNVFKTNGPIFTGFETLTHEVGSELEFDVSKDGNWLIYSTHQQGQKHRIVAKDMRTGQLFKMPSKQDSVYYSPSFSPDLSKVVYVKNNDKACEVWLIGFNQGEFDLASNRRVSRCGQPGYWTTTDFAEDGRSVYFGRSESLHDPFRIYRHNLDTSYERNLTAPTSSGRGDYAFSVSPDGTKLAIIRNRLWQSSRILVKNLEDDSIRVVDEIPYLLMGVQWYSPTELVYRGEGWQITRFNLESNEKSLLADLKQPVSFPVANNGRLFGYRGFSHNASVWSLSNDANGEFKTTKVLFSPYLDSTPVMASTSKLFFLSNRSGTEQLWHKEGERYVNYSDLSFPKMALSLHYSPQHQALFGISEERIFRFDVQTQQVTWVSSDQEKITNLSLSDDGRLVYAVEINEHWELRLHDIGSGIETKLGIEGFNAHLNDNKLYFTRYREHGLWMLDLNGDNEESLLIEDFEALSADFWDIMGDQIYYYRASDSTMLSHSAIDGSMLSSPLPIDGWVKNINCAQALDGCLFDLFQIGETEIIEIK